MRKSTKNKQRCPKCRKLFDKRGIKKHIEFCTAPKHVNGRPRYLVAAFDHDDVRVVKEEDLNDNLGYMLDNDIPMKSICIFEIGKELKIEDVRQEFILREVKR